jgi:hypothetical protein
MERRIGIGHLNNKHYESAQLVATVPYCTDPDMDLVNGGVAVHVYLLGDLSGPASDGDGHPLAALPTHSRQAALH